MWNGSNDLFWRYESGEKFASVKISACKGPYGGILWRIESYIGRPAKGGYLWQDYLRLADIRKSAKRFAKGKIIKIEKFGV
jgi:hypothetical protein